MIFVSKREMKQVLEREGQLLAQIEDLSRRLRRLERATDMVSDNTRKVYVSTYHPHYADEAYDVPINKVVRGLVEYLNRKIIHTPPTTSNESVTLGPK